MYIYKTKKCPGFPYDCKCNGLDYHRDEERRRGPIIRYAPMACPHVKPFLNAEWGDPTVDCRYVIQCDIMCCTVYVSVLYCILT